MKTKKKTTILIIGTGVLGAYLSKFFINKHFKIIVTTRKIKKNIENYKKLKIKQKITFKKLDILNKKDIEKIINKYNPKHIYYFAGQSSIVKSYKLRKQTIDSNYIGAKNFLEILKKQKSNIKFFKANSGYIFKSKNKKINLHSNFVKPKNPYEFAQIKAFKMVKHFRKLGLNCYSIIFFNIESPLRQKQFFIKKICIAVKKKKKIQVGNINTIRDYSWAQEIIKAVSLLKNIKPCDIILASGKGISGKEILKYTYSLNNLDYKKYIIVNKVLFRKNERKYVTSSIKQTLHKLKKFNWNPKIYKEKVINKMYYNILN